MMLSSIKSKKGGKRWQSVTGKIEGRDEKLALKISFLIENI